MSNAKKIQGDKQLEDFIAGIGKPTIKDDLATVRQELAAIRKAAPAEMQTKIAAELDIKKEKGS